MTKTTKNIITFFTGYLALIGSTIWGYYFAFYGEIPINNQIACFVFGSIALGTLLTMTFMALLHYAKSEV